MPAAITTADVVAEGAPGSQVPSLPLSLALPSEFPWPRPDPETGLGQEPGELIDHPSVWSGKHWAGRDDWVYRFTQEDIQELETATEKVIASGKNLKYITKEDFPLPKLGAVLARARDEGVYGRGFALFKGFPVKDRSREWVVTAYYGIGKHWGAARSNDLEGRLVHHIKDLGGNPNEPGVRFYTTSALHDYHTDSVADIVTLLCLHPSKSGGAFHFASSSLIHNEILKRRPDLLELLSKPLFVDMGGPVEAGRAFPFPVFNYHKGFQTSAYEYKRFLSAERFPHVPKLTGEQKEALELFNSIAEENKLTINWEQGDIALLYNHTTMHWREAFEDYEEPHKKRHLVRLWLSAPQDRPLPPVFQTWMFGGLEIGNRGGTPVRPGAEEHVPFYGEDGL